MGTSQGTRGPGRCIKAGMLVTLLLLLSPPSSTVPSTPSLSPTHNLYSPVPGVIAGPPACGLGTCGSSPAAQNRMTLFATAIQDFVLPEH